MCLFFNFYNNGHLANLILSNPPPHIHIFFIWRSKNKSQMLCLFFSVNSLHELLTERAFYVYHHHCAHIIPKKLMIIS